MLQCAADKIYFSTYCQMIPDFKKKYIKNFLVFFGYKFLYVTQGCDLYGVVCARCVIGRTNGWLFGMDFIYIIGIHSNKSYNLINY